MLPLFPVQNGQLIKSREFVELIGCGKVLFENQFFLKKIVSLLFNEQSPMEILSIKDENNIRFLFLIIFTIDW